MTQMMEKQKEMILDLLRGQDCKTLNIANSEILCQNELDPLQAGASFLTDDTFGDDDAAAIQAMEDITKALKGQLPDFCGVEVSAEESCVFLDVTFPCNLSTDYEALIKQIVTAVDAAL